MRSNWPESNQAGVTRARWSLIDGDGTAVVDEQAWMAGGTGAHADEVVVAVRLADQRRVGDEGLQAGPCDAGIGHPVIEGRHQLRLRHHRQVAQRERSSGQTFVQALVEPRSGARMGQQRSKP